MCARLRMHTGTRRAHTDMNTHAHTRKCTYKQVHIQVHTCVRAHAHVMCVDTQQARMHVRRDTCMGTDVRKHAHTHGVQQNEFDKTLETSKLEKMSAAVACL